jgi:hypothetical protein
MGKVVKEGKNKESARNNAWVNGGYNNKWK